MSCHMKEKHQWGFFLSSGHLSVKLFIPSFLRNSKDLYHCGRVGQVCHHGDLYFLCTACLCKLRTGKSFYFTAMIDYNVAVFVEWVVVFFRWNETDERKPICSSFIAVWLRWLDAQHSNLSATSSTNHKGHDKRGNNAADISRCQHNSSRNGHHVASQQAVVWLCEYQRLWKMTSVT